MLWQAALQEPRAEQLVTKTHLVNVNYSPSSQFARENTATLCLQCLVSEGPHSWLSFFYFFRFVERKPRHTSSMPTLPSVGQKEMKNAENYESLPSSSQRPK